MFRRIPLSLALGLSLVTPVLLRGQAVNSGAFVITLGADTLMLERYRLSGAGIEGDILTRGAVVTHRHYTLALAHNGTVSGLEMTTAQPGNPAAPVVRVTWTTTAGGDTTVTVLTRGDSSRTVRVATPGGVLPYFGWSGLLFERYLTWARAAAGGAPSLVATLSPGSSQPSTIAVAQVGRDSATITEQGEVAIRVRRDASGHLLGADGTATTEKYIVSRVGSLDFPALLASFANRPLGPLSPLDSVQAPIGPASVSVVYSRPSLRGRTAVGGILVPWNAVWRTGANAATRFTTSTDLTVAGQYVPAGTYTLFTLPSPSGWKLIISKQTRAPCQTTAQCADPNRRPLWGTDYSPDSDLVRVDMKVEAVSPSVEQFTIGVASQEAGGALWMAWETTKVSVPLAKP